MAGTIGGVVGNGVGVAGVSWNVTMIPLKFLGVDGGYTSDAVKALDYLTDLEVRHTRVAAFAAPASEEASGSRSRGAAAVAG